MAESTQTRPGIDTAVERIAELLREARERTIRLIGAAFGRRPAHSARSADESRSSGISATSRTSRSSGSTGTCTARWSSARCRASTTRSSIRGAYVVPRPPRPRRGARDPRRSASARARRSSRRSISRPAMRCCETDTCTRWSRSTSTSITRRSCRRCSSSSANRIVRRECRAVPQPAYRRRGRLDGAFPGGACRSARTTAAWRTTTSGRSTWSSFARSASTSRPSQRRSISSSWRTAGTVVASSGATRAGRGRRPSAPIHRNTGRVMDRRGTSRMFDRTGPVDPRRPVCHVTYHEAEAYARWAGKRLPNEFEWEAAASFDPAHGRAPRCSRGANDAWTRDDANLDQLSFDTAPVGAYPLNVSPLGCYGMIGDVWEWTSSDFAGIPATRRSRIPSTRKCFSERTTRCSAAARSPRAPAPSATRSATGTTPFAARSSAAFGAHPMTSIAGRSDASFRAELLRDVAWRASAPAEGAAAEVLLRSPRLGAVRRDHAAARVLPDANGARAARLLEHAAHGRAAARARSSSSGRAAPTRRACCSTPWWTRRAARCMCRSTSARSFLDDAAARLREEYPTLGIEPRRRRHRRPARPRSAHLPRPALIAFLGSTIGNFDAAGRACAPRERRARHASRRPVPARRRPAKEPGDHRGRVQRRARASRRNSI